MMNGNTPEDHYLLYQLLSQGKGQEPRMDEEMRRRMFMQKLMEMMQRRHGQGQQPPPAGRTLWGT